MQHGDSSASLSLTIAMLFSKNEDVISVLEPIIRKLAHLSEYAYGGFLLYGLFLTFEISNKKQVIFSGITGIIYAISDEIHQLFIDGRAGRIEDVIIDTIGIFIGICCLALLVKIVNFIVKKINQKG